MISVTDRITARLTDDVLFNSGKAKDDAVRDLLIDAKDDLIYGERQIESAFQQLEINGVSRERARHVANGIDVLTTRYRKAVSAYTAELQLKDVEISRLKLQLNLKRIALENARDLVAGGYYVEALGIMDDTLAAYKEP